MFITGLYLDSTHSTDNYICFFRFSVEAPQEVNKAVCPVSHLFLSRFAKLTLTIQFEKKYHQSKEFVPLFLKSM